MIFSTYCNCNPYIPYTDFLAYRTIPDTPTLATSRFLDDVNLKLIAENFSDKYYFSNFSAASNSYVAIICAVFFEKLALTWLAITEDENFHAASFVAKYRRVTSLESLRDQLRLYCDALKQQLYGIINRDYKDFITIATKVCWKTMNIFYRQSNS
jgi:hypothetical protein